MRSRVLWLVVLVLSAGCARLQDAPTPIAVTSIAAACATPVDTLIVLLPGAFDRPEDFVAEGFVDAVRSRHIAADIALVDATIPYYRDRTVVARIHDDVVVPAQARGIRHLWFAGISLGGLGGVIYANESHDLVDGLLLIAPYLGERSIVAEVAASGGVATWAPPGRIPDDDVDRRIWQGVRRLTAEDAGPRLYLGYGVDDRFASAHKLLAAALPADRVFTAPGGHDWPAWRPLWSTMLDAAPLPRDTTCGVSR